VFLQTYICPCFIKRTFVRVSSNVHLSVFYQTYVCACFFKRTFVRVLSNVRLSVFLQEYVCPCLFVIRLSAYDRPTYVLVLPYICPSLIKRTYIRILSSEVRFTKQVCPNLGQIERRQQFGQNTPELESQHRARRHIVRTNSTRSEGSDCNHQLPQPSYASHHVSRTEHNSA